MAVGQAAAEAEALIPHFQLDRVLNQDQAGRRIVLLGSIKKVQCLLTLERAPFSTSPAQLSTIPTTLRSLTNLISNDIYYVFMGSSGTAVSSNLDEPVDLHEDLKINLTYPCTQKHITKYSRQGVRYVTETAEIYEEKLRPYMAKQREDGRLQWVWNIIDGITEAEDVIYRIPKGLDPEHGFLLLPDLNWDRKTMESLHLLVLVERMDIWSLRDLRKRHIPWLQDMKEKILEATMRSYSMLERDQLKCYVHYQPTYYHFHIHVVHVALEAGTTQAVGKAWGLDSIISQLQHIEGGEEAGMDKVDMSYNLGEASDLWINVFEPLKKEKAEEEKKAAA